MDLQLEVAAATHIGLVRQRNEDSVGVVDDILADKDVKTWRLSASRAPIALIIADGVGGYPGGQLASRQAVGSALERTAELASASSIASTLQEIGEEITHRYAADRTYRNCSTTIAGLVIDSQMVRAFNLGDSRIYKADAGRLVQLSTDDVLARDGWGGRSHVLTQWLGASRIGQLDPHAVELPIEEGGCFLLCSDGLYDCVPEERIRELIASGDRRAAATNLIAAALDAGGHDNISFILCDILSRGGVA